MNMTLSKNVLEIRGGLQEHASPGTSCVRDEHSGPPHGYHSLNLWGQWHLPHPVRTSPFFGERELLTEIVFILRVCGART